MVSDRQSAGQGVMAQLHWRQGGDRVGSVALRVTCGARHRGSVRVARGAVAPALSEDNCAGADYDAELMLQAGLEASQVQGLCAL